MVRVIIALSLVLPYAVFAIQTGGPRSARSAGAVCTFTAWSSPKTGQTSVSATDVLLVRDKGPGTECVELSILRTGGSWDIAVANGVANHVVIVILVTLKDDNLSTRIQFERNISSETSACLVGPYEI